MGNDPNPLARPVLLLLAANAAVFLGGTALAYRVVKHDIALGLIMTAVGVITFFGLLAMPGACDGNGQFREARIRLSITATLLLVYLVFLGLAMFIKLEPSVTEIQKALLPTLTTLISVAVPFYFGASAAVEISTRLKGKNEKRESGAS